MTGNTTNQFALAGLNFDSHPTLVNENTVYYLRNADIADFSNSAQTSYAQNANSNELCVTLPFNTVLVGHVKLDKNDIILFLKGQDNDFIYLHDSELCSLTSIAEGQCLNFSENHYITGVYKYKNCDRIIYFTDGFNPMRYLNLDKIPFTQVDQCAECSPEYTSILDCNKLKFNKCATIPEIEIEQITGNMPDGVYQVAIAFSDEDETFSEWYIYSDVLNLHSLYTNSQRFGISLKLNCVSPVYDKYKIALICHRADRGTVAQEIGTFEAGQKHITISELDSAYYTPLSNEDLLSTKIYYQTAEHIATNGDHLVLSELTERLDFNYQLQANLIESFVDVIKIESKNAHKYPTFMGDEVYPFEIQWVYCDGQTTNWTHIPSNLIQDPLWFTDVNNKDTWSVPCEDDIKKYWQVYNTAELINVIEENDNGVSTPAIPPTPPDPGCKEYKFIGASPTWPGTLHYHDCEGNPVSDYGTIATLTFCTKTPDSASFVYDPFNKETDVIILDKCDPDSTDDTICFKFRIHPKYDGSQGNITYDSCTVTEDPPGTFTDNCLITVGPTDEDLETWRGCACNPDNDPELDIEFNIEVVPHTYRYAFVKQCDNGTEGSPGQEGGGCEGLVVATSTFAYWNSDINYPNEGFNNLPYLVNGDPCQTGIRYHKFPDRTAVFTPPSGPVKHFPHIHNQTALSNSKEFVYILAPRFENIQFPTDCNGDPVPDIIGYRIGVRDRSNHKSIIHKGLLYNMREEVLEDCETISYFPNYPFNDLHPDVFIGDRELLRASITGTGYVGFNPPMSRYSNKHFQYISPDIEYEKNDQQATELLTYAEENGYVEGSFQYTDEIPKIVIIESTIYATIRNLIFTAVVLDLIPTTGGGLDGVNFIARGLELVRKFIDGRQYALNQVSKSDYSRRNWNEIIQTNRRRRIDTSFYMQPTKQQFDGKKVNNYQRESGLFLELNDTLNNPSLQELSRILYGYFENKTYQDPTQATLRTSSYYVGLKKNLPSQYGNINDGIVKPISNILSTASTGVLIGGDVYITKHTFYKKFPFFTCLPLGAPYDSQFTTSSCLNVGFPTYYLDTERNEFVNLLTKGGAFGRLLKATKFKIFSEPYYLEEDSNGGYGTILKSSCKKKTKNKRRIGIVDGHFYTHLIGITEYYTESEYVGPYRETNEIEQSRYYPVKDMTDFVPYENVQYPELFLYNQQQRWKGINSKYSHSRQLSCPIEDCYSKNRIIFSTKQDTFSSTDRWLNFPPNNYHQFNQQDGSFTTTFSINNYNLLFLFDNAAYITQTDEGLLTTQGIAYLGQGSIFERRLKKISSEVNGLGGCLDKYAVVNTPYGTFWPDRNRKTFVSFSQGLEDISTNMKSWFNEFLNSPLYGQYDPFTRNIYWTSDGYTISYKPETKSWISFHDFIPERYLPMNYNFLSYKDGGIWKHNVKDNYQTYYGITHPFEIGYTINNKLQQTVLQSVEVFSESYINEAFGKKKYIDDKFFNQLFVYNDHVSTNIETLKLKDPNNPADFLTQNKLNSEIEVTNTEYNIYRINGFENFATSGSHIEWQPNGYLYNAINSAETTLVSNGLIRGKWFNLHLRANSEPTHKKTVQLSVNLVDNVNQ